jgi:type 2 lantibiotic biosynthesis protein LanM
VDNFFERLVVRAATIDERLSDYFEILPGQKRDADLAARRLAAWCRASASGDWSLFARRLDRDKLSIGQVLTKFATVRPVASASAPGWIDDAMWIEATLQSPCDDRDAIATPHQTNSCAFEHLFGPVVERAEMLLWSGIGGRGSSNLTDSARGCLRHSLLEQVCGLAAPAIYERFVEARKDSATNADGKDTQRDGSRARYNRFVADMRGGGFRRLFEDKPVLLRLIASITRQWIDTSREFVMRLDSDLAVIRRDVLCVDGGSRVTKIEGELSDPHNNGRSVLIVRFEDGLAVVYKPKDLRLDAAWHSMVERLNRNGAPTDLKSVKAIARDGYGWTEFIEHTGCADETGCDRFFERAGAWLALFHCFASSDMHQENVIAAGEHPMPIDLEMILQAAAAEHKTEEIETQAYQVATEIVDNSILTVGLLPVYGQSPDNKVVAVGGMISDWTSRTELGWSNINSDTMRPTKIKKVGGAIPNLPHVDGRYAMFGDHIDSFITGFEDYANFLSQSPSAKQGELLEEFAGLGVRKLIRPTRFYYMLLQRLRDHRSMDDGVTWSAQADFLARLSDWEKASDSLWPLQRAERAALLTLNVPHFVLPNDDDRIQDATGISVRTGATPGLNRARTRVSNFHATNIEWQVEVIRQNTASLLRSAGPAPVAAKASRVLRTTAAITPSRESFLAEADKIAADLGHHAIRKGSAAAWIGLAWLGDSDTAQLVPLGADLYNGDSGIALFLAAHAAITENETSRKLALAAVARVRKNLKGHNAPRIARSLGTGGGTGLGSIVYAFAVMAKCLRDDGLLEDAHGAAKLFTDDLIGADKRLDVIGGSAGAILGLLRLYRDSPSADVLANAAKCGDHLLSQPRRGENGGSWVGQGSGEKPLNGMSHGAAGFAYALASLATATGRGEFASAAAQCIAFENASYDAQRNNWSDFRGEEGSLWPCQWCHGAPGIGIARAGSAKFGWQDSNLLIADIRNAVTGVERGWPGHVDTLCCGTLGSIEFFCEAAEALGQSELREHASRLLSAVMQDAAVNGDYRWNIGKRQFNLGLFRGLAGVGYTLLRRVDASLPNVLIWE